MGYDIIVLGTGPAGLAAAVGARGRNKSVLVIGNRWEDSPLAKAERVDNYLGMPGRTGMELLREYYDHAAAMGVEFVTGRAISLMAWNGFMVTVGSQFYEGKALILAPGVVRQAKYPGETEYLGRGVSYCATCDGMLYRGKNVAVLGYTDTARHEAEFLQGIGCSVTYFPNPKSCTISGGSHVEQIVCDGERADVEGVFILRPTMAPTDIFPGLAVENGYVAVDRKMATNLPGVFAAGDCTGGPLQVSKATGEGLIAGQSAAAYAAMIARKEMK